MKLSILIPAYKAERYIAETLRSVYEQDIPWNEENVEVLVGIDHCPDTLDAVVQSPATYTNLRVFMMDSNQGTYVTRNTLITLARGAWILFFDADDVMKSGMLQRVMDAMPGYDLVRYYCERSKGEAGPSRDIVLQHGSFLAHRRVFERLGGFKAWRCAADTDFHKRIPPDLKQKNILESLFYYRVHEKSLTQDEATGMKSAVRNAYIRQMATQFEYVDPVVNSWKEIELSPYQRLKPAYGT